MIQWFLNAPEEIELPSGKVAALMRPHIGPVLAAATDEEKMIIGRFMCYPDTSRAIIHVPAEERRALITTAQLLAIHTFMEPRVWRNGWRDETHIPAGWLEYDDLMFIVAYAMGVTHLGLRNGPADVSEFWAF